MDWSVGQIFEQLKTLGLDDNTFVIWSKYVYSIDFTFNLAVATMDLLFTCKSRIQQIIPNGVKYVSLIRLLTNKLIVNRPGMQDRSLAEKELPGRY